MSPIFFSIENVDTFPSSSDTTRGSRDKYIASRDENKPASVILILIGTTLIPRPRRITFAHIAKIYCGDFGELQDSVRDLDFSVICTYFKRIISLTAPVNSIVIIFSVILDNCYYFSKNEN